MTLGATLGRPLNRNRKRSPNLLQIGAPRPPKITHFGTRGGQKGAQTTKKLLKNGLESGAGKVDEKVTNQDPPEPQKVGFRLRGSAIQQKPTNSQKVTKKSSKRLQNETKTEPEGPKRPSKGP